MRVHPIFRTSAILWVTSAFAQTLSVQPPTLTVTPGQSYSLDIDIVNITDLFAFQFDVTFDPTLIMATGVTEGTFFSANGVSFFPGIIDNVGGSVSSIADSLSGFGPCFTGSDTLATVRFQALGAGSSPIDIANVILLDSNLNDITSTVGVNGGNVTVQQPSGVPEPASFLLFAAGLVVVSLATRRMRDR
jgi:hypothetical protein